MRTRSVLIRYSNAIWIADGTGPFEQSLRPFWLNMLHNQSWQEFSAGDSTQLLRALLERSKRPELRHLPPFRPFVGPTLQGGNQRAFSGDGHDVEDPRFLPLRVYARSRPFRVKTPYDVDCHARLGAQLFLSGYLIVELWFRLRAREDLIGGESLWQIARALNPNTLGSEALLEKPGLRGTPREFTQGLMEAISHSLLTPAEKPLGAREPWYSMLMAENGPARTPSGMLGYNLASVLDFGGSSLVSGERGLYYSEDPSRKPSVVKKRFDTVRVVYDFARYYRDCLAWANQEAKRTATQLSHLNLQGGEARALFDVGQAALHGKNLAEFIRALDVVKSSTSQTTTKWQRKLYSVISHPLGVAEARDKFQKNFGTLSSEIRTARGAGLSDAVRDDQFHDTDVFISYTRSAYRPVAKIKAALEDLGLNVFLDVDGIDAGEGWQGKVSDVVYDSKAVLGCFTKGALKKRWVQEECALAHQRNKLVAAILEPVPDDEFRGLLIPGHANLADFDGAPSHKGWQQVLRAISRLMKIWALANPERDEAGAALRRAEALLAAADG